MTKEQSSITIQPYIRPPETKEDLDYADLAEIDLSKWDKPGGKEELVDDIRHAVTEVGFWYVTNTGITDEEILRQLAIGYALLDLPVEEKNKHPCDFANGNYFGYRGVTRTHGKTGVKENAEALNLPKVTPSQEHEFPNGIGFIKDLKQEIGEFQTKVYNTVIERLYKLFALLLELPEDYFAAPHKFERATEDHLRYMRYFPRDAEIDKTVDNIHLHGHTDFGLLTLLFPQVVAGLQIKNKDGEWKYAKYLPNGILVNTGDVFSFLTNGYLKSTIHRVVRPPEDQANYVRMGLFYFSRSANDLDMVIAPSPVLQKLGLYDPEKTPDKPVKGIEFTRGRVKHNWNRDQLYSEDFNAGFKIGNLSVQTIHV